MREYAKHSSGPGIVQKTRSCANWLLVSLRRWDIPTQVQGYGSEVLLCHKDIAVTGNPWRELPESNIPMGDSGHQYAALSLAEVIARR
jgi:hypothetical protein